jgi:FMN reductase (NADPH)/FMN reductase [NAD(P)H]
MTPGTKSRRKAGFLFQAKPLWKEPAMNPTIDLLLARKSVRAYANRPITAAEKETILQAAMRAPTAGNMMLYTIIEVEDPALKERLAVTCDDQPFIAAAPYLLLFLADYQRWYDAYLAAGVPAMCEERGVAMRRPEEGDLLLACCDTLIAAHSTVVAADALGIGSCYIGDIIERYEEHRQMFHLPQYVLPVTLVCFGYPTPEQAARPQTPRFPEEAVVHQNTYRRMAPEALEAMFQPRTVRLNANGPRADGIRNAPQFNYFKKFSAEFSVEMTRSVRAMLASWTAKPD